MKKMMLIPALLLALTAPASAKSFTDAPILADQGVEVFNRTVANERVDRDLFGSPYATAVVGRVDVYDGFPYLESRYFQVVSDPGWDRLLYGEMGRSLAAYDGSLGIFGELSSPRGLSVDEDGRLYVADSGNHRVLVFATSNEFDQLTLSPIFAIDGLSRPYDVAYSDGGTPFVRTDDRLYVADTGRNRVVSFALTGSGATRIASIGDLGSGVGRFAGPMALTVGRVDGAHTADVYVSDSHNRRLVRLRDDGDALAWVGTRGHDTGLATSLDTDHWGNVYVAGTETNVVAKYTADLEPLAAMEGATRPRSFHVPFVSQTDHRDGSVRRVGQGSGLLVEEWTSTTGIRLVKLGVEIGHLDVRSDLAEELSASFVMTDRGHVSAEIVESATGRVAIQKDLGELDAGEIRIAFTEAELDGHLADGSHVLRVHASSTYEGGAADEREASFDWAGSGLVAVSHPSLLGNSPNPFRSATSLRFAIPAGGSSSFALRVYDVAGRLVRTLADGSIDSGVHSVTWDGRDDAGRQVASGVYMYRLVADADVSTRKMVFLR